MPGVPGRSGRRGKLTAQHIAEGTYRADRHGERVELAIGSSKPRPMLLLGKDEQELCFQESNTNGLNNPFTERSSSECRLLTTETRQ